MASFSDARISYNHKLIKNDLHISSLLATCRFPMSYVYNVLIGIVMIEPDVAFLHELMLLSCGSCSAGLGHRGGWQ